MFRVRFPLQELRAQAANIDQRLRKEQPTILMVLGVQLLSFVSEAYNVKSRGGTGSDGITWKPLNPKTIKAKNRRGKRNFKRTATKSGKERPTANDSLIGVNTGLQRASASPGFRGDAQAFVLGEAQITVGFNLSYSKFFDETRPLLPDPIPESWQRELEALVQDWADRIVKEELK